MTTATQVYAHVVNGALVEYPLTEEIIANRGLPLEMFTPVVKDVVPEVPAFHDLSERCVMKLGYPTIVYELKPQGLATLLQKANGFTGMVTVDTPDVFLKDVDPALVTRVYQLVRNHIQERLDAFAATREYDNIASAITYRGSSIPKFAAEAERAFALRDLAWIQLNTFMAEMMDPENPVPIPKSVQEVESHIPELTWEEVADPVA